MQDVDTGHSWGKSYGRISRGSSITGDPSPFFHGLPKFYDNGAKLTAPRSYDPLLPIIECCNLLCPFCKRYKLDGEKAFE